MRPSLGGFVAFSTVLGLGLADGGYFPRAWGIGAVLLCGGVGLGLLRGGLIGRLEQVFALGILALACFAALSLNWTSSTTLTMLEVERTVLYAVVAAAFVLLARRADELLRGFVAAATFLSTWALFEHLVVDRNVDAYQGALLTGSIGYANALGAVAAIGSVAAVSLGAATPARWAYVALAQLLLASTALTSSRGALVGWLLGAAVATALSRARVRLAILAGFATLLSLGVAVAASALGVTRGAVASADVVWEGRAVFLLVLGSAAAIALVARALPEELPSIGPKAGGAVVVSVAAAVLIGSVLVGPDIGDRPKYWQVAADALREKPLLGHGPGTFERLWLEHRSIRSEARDAHSLYLETSAEQGIVGGLVLVLVLSLPVAVVVRQRGTIAAAAGGAYATFLAHAGLDWDWEMPVVTTSGLVAGVACLKLAPAENVIALSRGARAGLAGVLAIVFAGSAFALAGNWRVTAARDQLAANRPASAFASATRAASLQPWSSEPLVLSAQSRLLLGDPSGARDDLVRAVARDPTVWLGWWLLALTSDRPDERALASRQAERLNPLFARPAAAP